MKEKQLDLDIVPPGTVPRRRGALTRRRLLVAVAMMVNIAALALLWWPAMPVRSVPSVGLSEDQDYLKLLELEKLGKPQSFRPCHHSHRPSVDYKTLEQLLLTSPDPQRIRESSKYYTAGPHLAGKNLSQAAWTRDTWAASGVDSAEVVAYDVYINYPRDHRLALLSGTDGKDGVLYEASLEEDVLPEDPTSGLADRVPTFHGYSASGNVTAPLVYANFGTYADYADLERAGISVAGKVVIVRYGNVFRGLKVKRAQELGALAVIIYSDPLEDGEVVEENGYKPYPEGPARNPSSVQRGSVQYLSRSLRRWLSVC